MEDFQKNFKISIRDLNSNNQFKKSRKILKYLEGITGKIILTTQKISKNIEKNQKISKHDKICKKMQIIISHANWSMI